VSHSSQNSDKAWYEQWFGREYLELYAHRNDAEARNDIDAVERLLSLSTDEAILDLACGGGRHSIELARRGYTVTGIDLSAELLEQAENSAASAGFEIPFLRCDMREHPFEAEFGYLLNMFTSFGYFENDVENERIMAAINRALKPEGAFIIDYINMHSVLASLVPEDQQFIKGKTVVQKRHYNQQTRRLIKEIIISDEKGTRQFTESVRLYNQQDMIAMAERAGLNITQCLGSLQGEEYNNQSPRLILIGHKV